MAKSHKDRKTKGLTQMLNDAGQYGKSRKLSVENIVKHFKSRSVGTFLLIPAVIMMLPTGAIPFVPAVCGMVAAFACVQIIMGRTHLWLPKQFAAFAVPRSKFKKGVELIRPYTEWLDKVTHRRMNFLATPLSEKITAFFCLLLCLTIIFIGFIPMLPAMLALPLLLFGLGFIVNDGVAVAAGYLALIGNVASIWLLIALT